MKRIVFLLFLFPVISFACQEHPDSNSDQPLWVQALVKAASGHEHHTKDQKSSQKKEDPKDKNQIKKASN